MSNFIVSNRNGPTTRISWLFARLLKPRLKDAPAHLNNSLDLILDIQAKDKLAHQRYPYLFSLDVVSLYTSIPVSDAIACVTDEIHTSSNGLTREDIKDLLMIVLHNTYFQYESSIYLQVQGLPMGSSLSGILAILFMDKLEKKALFSCLYIDPYKRYVDDIYAQTTDESNADAFHEHMNSQHPNIKFDIEKPNPTPEGNCLSLLDFTVHLTNEGNAEFNFYKKKAKKPLFEHHKSALPKRSKVNIIRNERKRINQRCSTEANKNKHNNDLNYMLRLNGYPSNKINGTLNRESHNSQAPQSDNNGPKWLYLKIPYISDRIDYRITKLFKKEGIPVRITHESTALRQVLNTRRSNPTSCQRPECIISNKNLCFAKNCIYRIECTTCHLIYIGRTIRNLHDRVKEHVTRPASSIYKHFAAHHKIDNINDGITVTIIAKERDPVNLRLKEAYYIRKLRPEINNREERSELTELLF